MTPSASLPARALGGRHGGERHHGADRQRPPEARRVRWAGPLRAFYTLNSQAIHRHLYRGTPLSKLTGSDPGARGVPLGNRSPRPLVLVTPSAMLSTSASVSPDRTRAPRRPVAVITRSPRATPPRSAHSLRRLRSSAPAEASHGRRRPDARGSPGVLRRHDRAQPRSLPRAGGGVLPSPLERLDDSRRFASGSARVGGRQTSWSLRGRRRDIAASPADGRRGMHAGANCEQCRGPVLQARTASRDLALRRGIQAECLMEMDRMRMRDSALSSVSDGGRPRRPAALWRRHGDRSRFWPAHLALIPVPTYG